MSGAIVNTILQQISQHLNARQIRHLLFLKLEMEFNSDRGVIRGEFEPYVAVETEVRNYGDPIPSETIEEKQPPEAAEEKEESSNADV